MSELRRQVTDIIREKGLMRLPEPVQLASGQMSRDFIDVKVALANGADLAVACRAIIEVAAVVEYQAVGGLTMGADQFAHGIAILGAKQWFVVRKEPKGRGTNKLVEGAAIEPGMRVLLVEDTVTTGGSIQKAYETITELGAVVAGAVTVVDRGEEAAKFFADRGTPYFAVVTYRDLDIDPVEPVEV